MSEPSPGLCKDPYQGIWIPCDTETGRPIWKGVEAPAAKFNVYYEAPVTSSPWVILALTVALLLSAAAAVVWSSRAHRYR